MFKKIIFLLIPLIVLTAHFVFAGPSMGGEPVSGTVLLSEQTINFTNKPFILNGEVMVPAKDFFEKIGSQVLLIENSNEVVSYRDNIFMKFKPNSPVALVNGKQKNMPVSAFIHEGELFIPASFASMSNEMNYTADETLRTISIDYRENVLEYQQFGFRHFKRQSLANWGISFFIPEYWTRNEDAIATFGVENSFESYRLVAELLPLDNQQTRATITDAEVNALKATYGESLEIASISTMTLGEYTSDVVYYNLNIDGLTTHQILYVFFEQNHGYILRGSYPSTNDFLESKDIFDTIASTFSITKLTVNENLEHYTEMTRFFEYEISLNSELYSNMPVDNHFKFSGTIGNPKDLIGLRIFVSKDDQVTDYYIPLIDNTFNTTIFTPFGLGKHNITVIADDGTNHNSNAFASLDPLVNTVDDYVSQIILFDSHFDPSKSIVKFSVINASDEPIKDFLATDYVNYDHPDVYNIANALTFTLTNQYSKSRILYQWIIDNYSYTDQIRADGLMNMHDLIDTNEANAVELGFIYTGLLRASDIPARMARGIKEDGIDYWVETYINGQWLVSSITTDVQDANAILDYFNINRALHYENYITVEILPF